MKVNYIVDVMTEKKINELNKYGYILGGHNGPYYDSDTPVRNTAHWATIFSYYYNKTKEQKYYDAVKKCGNYLVSKEVRPMNANFFCRYNTKKDFANGTIGASWAIEGLVSAYKVIKDEKYLEVAKEVFLLFPFDKTYNLWKIINVDGSIRDFDMTFNHQLWFATSGVILLSVTDDEEISKRSDLYFRNIDKIFVTNKSGLVRHSIVTKLSKLDKIKSLIKTMKSLYSKISMNKSMQYKESGYHLFNLYAFALIKEYGCQLNLFKTEKFKKALRYCFNDELYNWLENKNIKYDLNKMPKVKSTRINIYGYSYNAPGFELPYIYKVFKEELPEEDEFIESVIQKQIDFTFNKDKMSFCENNEDENTLNARLYEYVRSLSVEGK